MNVLTKKRTLKKKTQNRRHAYPIVPDVNNPENIENENKYEEEKITLNRINIKLVQKYFLDLHVYAAMTITCIATVLAIYRIFKKK